MLSERAAFLEEKTDCTNKANGFRNVLKAGIAKGLQLSIPRDRLGVFKPLIIGTLNQQEEQIKSLSFSLYGKGLTTREISNVLEDIYGNSYSKSTVSRMSEVFHEEIDEWLARPLESYYPIVFVDALYLKVRRDVVSTEAFYVVLGVKDDFTREVLGVINIPTESASGWEDVLNTLKDRGMNEVSLFVSDDLKGLSTSISKVYPNSKQQKCVVHFQRNLGRQVRVKDREEFFLGLKKIFDPDNMRRTQVNSLRLLRAFLVTWSKHYPYLKGVSLRLDLSLYFTYLSYDRHVRSMIYTTNWIERFNKSVKRTTKVRNALPTPRAGLMLIGYVGMEMGEGTYKYPIANFKFEAAFDKKVDC